MPTKSMQEIDAISTATPVPVGASDQFMAALAEAVPASEYTGSVPLVENKDALADIPFIVLGYSMIAGDFGDYVNVRIMLPNNAVLCFNDGGSSIIPVLVQHATEHDVRADDDSAYQEFVKPLYCPRGLRRSDYRTEIDGRTMDATTYHLS